MRLRFSQPALRDLETILAYLSARSPHGAHRVQRRVRDTINILRQHPYVGQATSRPETRRIVASPYPYLIFYGVSDDEVIIRAIRHAARDTEPLTG